ncbi:MAG: PAS domain S-box protein [Betaproteobacteria bacterium]|nr:MAG: PAS domain S-box protein [Betaproteobacteria bacterium]
MALHTDPPHDGLMLHCTQTPAELSRFRVAMDVSGDAIYLVDRTSMRFVDVNQTACMRMGYSREELLQMGPQDLLTISREEIERLYDQLIAAGASGTTTESSARTKDGRQSTTELHRRAVRMDGGWIIVSIARDITQRKHMEQALRESEERFRITFELAGSGIAHVDLAGRLLRVNRSLCAILGYCGPELVGRTVKELSHPEDRDKSDAARARVRSGELQSTRLQQRYLRKDGATVWVDLTVALVRDAEGQALYEIAVIDDDTERKNAEAALHESAEKLRLFADNVPAMTVSWDEHLHCGFANKLFTEFFGLAAEDIVGKHVREVLGEAVYREIEGHLVKALQGHAVTYERIGRLRSGESRYLEVKLLPHIGEQGKVLGCFSVTTDITEHKLAAERIQRVAHHDSLTGLPNRLLFNDRLAQALSLAKRNSRQFALLYLDLDRFKPVNDALGHAAGDELLKCVATRIQREVRASDTVARVGGDEFTVILHDIARREDAETVAGKIRAALTTPFQLGSRKQAVDIGTSIGIAVYPADAQDADALISMADAAMYRAKQAGGTTVGLPRGAGKAHTA